MYSKAVGGISWVDLTVKDADKIKDFYKTVIGLETESIAVDDYNDYVLMSPKNSDDQVGICHAKGLNDNMPSQWLIYFNVDGIDQSIQQCKTLGGKIVKNKSNMGDYIMCIIQDPFGAIAALISKK